MYTCMFQKNVIKRDRVDAFIILLFMLLFAVLLMGLKRRDRFVNAITSEGLI